MEGRSGGALFSSEGFVIGVCNGAMREENEGMYAGLEAIQGELDRANVSFVYRNDGGRTDPAAVAAADPPPMPKKMPDPTGAIQLTGLSQQSSPSGPGSSAQLGEEKQAATDEILNRKGEVDEVICVIRSRTNPQTQSEIIVVDKVSPVFLRQLAGLNQQSPPPRIGSSERPSEEEQAAMDEILRRHAEGAEVICVIRSRTNPQAQSEIIVVDKAPLAFRQRFAVEPQSGGNARRAEMERRVELTTVSKSAVALAAAGDRTSASPQPEDLQWRPRWLRGDYRGE